jgi:membrane-bound serine protease (ClpP class)
MKLSNACRLIFVSLLLWFIPLAKAEPTSSAPDVVVIHLKDTVQPVSEAYLSRGIDAAAAQHAAAVVIEMDTPGGLLTSMRAMTSKILASPVPVIVFVAPTGARAGSAGFFLLEAADIAAMAPGTNAGAAHPVVEGAKIDDTMKMKLENDAAAFLRSYTSRRGRNPSAAEDAVRQSKSYTEKEAKDLGLIDVIAPDIPSLLNQVDGRTVTRFDGSTVVLHTRNAIQVDVNPTVRERVLDWLMDPNLAVLILVLGGLLIYIEFNAPGTIIPGALGTLFVLLSLFALNLLPVHYASGLLLIAAFALMLLEAKFTSHGVLGFAGIVCLVFGVLTLVDGPIPEMRVHLATAIATGIGFGLITLFLVRIAVIARRNKTVLGVDTLIGQTAITSDAIHPDTGGPDKSGGQIFIHGELWQARSTQPIRKGESVRVTGREGLLLFVERIP